MKGAAAAGITMLFAPLPLMVAGMAFAPSSALTGGVAGALLILDSGPRILCAVLPGLGLPPCLLADAARLAGAPAEEGENAGPDNLVWYPVGGLVFWCAILGAGVATALMFAGVLHAGGYEPFVAQIVGMLTPILETVLKSPSGPKLPEGATSRDLATYAAVVMPAVLAAWATFAYAANLWIAGRVTEISKMLTRPWLALRSICGCRRPP